MLTLAEEVIFDFLREMLVMFPCAMAVRVARVEDREFFADFGGKDPIDIFREKGSHDRW